MPMPAAEITPIPPARETALARPDKEIPTPMPPWTMGSLDTTFPIRSSGIVSILFSLLMMTCPLLCLSRIIVLAHALLHGLLNQPIGVRVDGDCCCQGQDLGTSLPCKDYIGHNLSHFSE